VGVNNSVVWRWGDFMQSLFEIIGFLLFIIWIEDF